MKKKLLALFTATLMVVAMIPMFAFPALAEGGLTVTKIDDAGNVVQANVGTDYLWNSEQDDLIIRVNGLTVSGHANNNVHITVNDNVTELTLDTVDISTAYDAVKINNSGAKFTLKITGTNSLKGDDPNNHASGLVSDVDLEIKGNGVLNVTTDDSGQAGIKTNGALTIDMAGGAIVARATMMSYGISAMSVNINAIQKLLVRGNDSGHGAIYCPSGNSAIDSLAEGLTITGSTDHNAEESAITYDVDYKSNYKVYIKGTNDVAKAVLIQPIKYDVKVSSEIKNGKVKADKEKAAKGETVTLTATPDEAYQLTKLKVTDADKKEVTVTDNKFEMPKSNVTITAEFETKEYKMKKGENQEIDLANVKDVTFSSEADSSKFVGVKVDDKAVDSKNYTVKSGSTIVTLKADYLKTLKTGKHKIKIVSEDGIATAEFTVINTTPKTADANNMILWIVIALATAGLATGTILRVKKTNK